MYPLECNTCVHYSVLWLQNASKTQLQLVIIQMVDGGANYVSFTTKHTQPLLYSHSFYAFVF